MDIESKVSSSIYLTNFKAKLNIIGYTTFTLALFFMWHMSPPAGLAINAWKLFVIFLATIISLVLKPLPMGSIAILAISACTITKTLTIEQALSSFGSKTVWLVLSAFLLARAFTKTGLGARIAYCFVYLFGKNSFGLSYSLIGAELILAPFIPSNTARGAGIIFPILSSLNLEAKNYLNSQDSNSLGKYLLKICFHANLITSAMFLTAMAANPIIASFAKTVGVTITWSSWFKAAIIPGTISLGLLPFVMFFLSPPNIIHTPGAKIFAGEKLKKMGNLSSRELIMAATLCCLIILWFFGDKMGVDATTAAFLGLAILLVTKVIDVDDILSEKAGWNAFIWLATLLVMTIHLKEFGFINWLGDVLQAKVHHFNWIIAFLLICAFYFYSHYLFASLIAHITTMYTTFLVILKTIGAPMVQSVYLLAFLSSLCACLSHFGTGTAPVYFGANLFSVKQWWRIGFWISIFHLLVWGGIGYTVLQYLQL